MHEFTDGAIIKEMFIDRETRAESLNYLRDPEADLSLSPPPGPDEATEAEINEYLAAIKPKHYAALAFCLNDLLEIALAEPLPSQEEHRTEVGVRLARADDPWSVMASDCLITLNAAVKLLPTLPSYHLAATYPPVISNLDPDRHYQLDTQMEAGSQTATINMLALLHGLPGLIHEFAPDSSNVGPLDLSKIARRSVGLPWKMSMMSVKQMMAMKFVLSGNNESGASWGSFPKLEARYFKAQRRDEKVWAINFKDIEDVIVPAGYTPGWWTQATKTSIPLKDYSADHSPAVGCPITLLDRRLHQMWYWLIDAVDERQLWSKTKT